MQAHARHVPLLRRVARAPAGLARLWNREFQDARLILEQNGDLRYLVVTARLQRWATRTAISAGACALASLVVLGAAAVHLQAGKARLETSHKAIYAALLDSTKDLTEDETRDFSEADMLELARSIRERDREMRKMVSSATNTLSEENHNLHASLGQSGLTEAAVKVIQSNTAMGGYSRDLDAHPDPLLRGGFVEESAKNRELKDVLLALPSRMPINDHYTTSHFGVRKHPISGRPRFHAGLDLVSRSDDRVYSVKPGKVILARDYNDYGNTVIVRHERGIETLYAHLASLGVKEGQEVDTLTVLGMVGNTGASTGKHLHFEISVGGYPVDPLKVITTAQNVQQAQR
jgi:murein DD-endopeptidase MepM/ murein hydrolase activator NlpD